MFLSVYLVRGEPITDFEHQEQRYVSACIELKTLCIECSPDHSPVVSKIDALYEERDTEHWRLDLPQEEIATATALLLQSVRKIRPDKCDPDVTNNIIMHQFFKLIPATSDLID